MSAAEMLNKNIFGKSKPTSYSSYGTSQMSKSGGNSSTTKGTLEYEVGDTVKHMKFGVGKVISIDDAGRDYEVLVNFETAGQKRMFASFAKLKKV